MGIIVDWGNEERTIMLTTFEGEWDLNDFYGMVDAGARLLKDVDYPFVTIVDYSQSLTPPRKTLTIGRHVGRTHNPNRKKVIFVKPGLFVERLYSMLGGLYPEGFGDAQTVETLDEAYALAKKVLQAVKSG
ncbi:MAG: hypothetical protein K8L99_36330 [Anaerolineae bacterium]|nr:hypothetical protein [Anaerolineae bacterium]